MTPARITVTIPEQLARDARQAVDEGRAESVGAYVADAMHHYGRTTTLRDLLDDPDDLAALDPTLSLIVV